MGKKFLRTESVILITFPSFVESNTQADYLMLRKMGAVVEIWLESLISTFTWG